MLKKKSDIKMTLQPTDKYVILSDKFEVLGAVFPLGNIKMWVSDEFGLFFNDAHLIRFFTRRSQSTEYPLRLVLPQIFIHLFEGLTGFQSADVICSRIDGNTYLHFVR